MRAKHRAKPRCPSVLLAYGFAVLTLRALVVRRRYAAVLLLSTLAELGRCRPRARKAPGRWTHRGGRGLINDAEANVNCIIIGARRGVRRRVLRGQAPERVLNDRGRLEQLARACKASGFRHPSGHSPVDFHWRLSALGAQCIRSAKAALTSALARKAPSTTMESMVAWASSGDTSSAMLTKPSPWI
jgi:hypothetical protein